MNKQKFLKILDSYNQVSDKDLTQLRELEKDYPYSQVIHNLIAKGSIDNKRKDASQKLNLAAFYSPDRIALKNLIENKLDWGVAVEEAPKRKSVKTELPKKPEAAERPKSPEKPKAVEKPKAAEKPKVAEKPKATEKPKVHEKPKAVGKPKAEEKPRTPEKPKAEVKPKAAEKTAAKPEVKPKPQKVAKTEQPKTTKKVDAEELRTEVMKNLKELQKSKKKYLDVEKKTTAAKKKTTAKKSTATKKAASPAKAKTSAKGTTAKSTAKSKTTTKKDTAKAASARKTTATKTTAKKATSSASTAKKTAADKTTKTSTAAKKVTTTRATTKKTAASKSTAAKKATATKSTATAKTKKKPTGAVKKKAGKPVKVSPKSPEEELEQLSAAGAVDYMADIESKKAKKQHSAKQKEQFEIIEKFLSGDKEPSSGGKKAQSDTQQDLSIESVEFNENLVSENLALILVKQGKTDKAIDIYKRLIWKFPQKKTYFAAQIEELKKK